MEQITQLYKAFSDETRLRIIMLLVHGELCVCDLMAILELPQSKVSRHLSFLKKSNLITSERVGVWMHYSLKQWTDELYSAQIKFLKEKFSHLSQFSFDLQKMHELKRNKMIRCV